MEKHGLQNQEQSITKKLSAILEHQDFNEQNSIDTFCILYLSKSRQLSMATLVDETKPLCTGEK